jgi:hypothetical protein
MLDFFAAAVIAKQFRSSRRAVLLGGRTMALRATFGLVALAALSLVACSGGAGDSDEDGEGPGTDQYLSIIGGWSGEDGGIEFVIGERNVSSCAHLDWLSISVGSSSLCPAGVCAQSETRYYYDVPLSASGSEYLFAVADETFTVTGTLHSPSSASGTARYQDEDLPGWTAEHVRGGGEACPPGGIGPCEGRTLEECVGECVPARVDRIEVARGCRLENAPFSCLPRMSGFGPDRGCEGERVGAIAGDGICWVVGADCVAHAFEPFESSATCDEVVLPLETSLDVSSLPECAELDAEGEAARGACGKLRSCCCQLPEDGRAECLSIADAPDATDPSCYDLLQAGFDTACAAAAVDFSVPGDCESTPASGVFACADVEACCTDRTDPAVAEVCAGFFAMCAAATDPSMQALCTNLEQISTMAPASCPQTVVGFELLGLCTS